jgi:hypothetical protein
MCVMMRTAVRAGSGSTLVNTARDIPAEGKERVMITFWRDRNLKKHQLTVFPDSSVTGGPWNTVFTDALLEINFLFSSLQLGITLIDARSTTPPTGPPNSNGIDGADVLFQAVNGPINFTLLGQKLMDPNRDPPGPFVLSGNGIHGLTLKPEFPLGGEGLRILKAVVSVPITPMCTAGPVGKQKYRPVGKEVMKFIAVHELVHVTGLNNAEHSPEFNPDVFCGPPISNPQIDPDENPDKDRIRLKPPNMTPTGFIPGVYAPPITISARTANLIRWIWVLGSLSPHL